MKNRRIVFCILLSVLLLFAGCATGTPATQDQTGGETVGETQTKAAPEISAVSFSEMPETDVDMISVEVSETTAYFEFITPGMDSSSIRIVCYSLTEDKLLGTKDLGDGVMKIYPAKQGGFYAVKADATLILFDDACNEVSRHTIPGETLGIRAAQPDDDRGLWLFESMRDGGFAFFDTSVDSVRKISLPSGQFTLIGYANSRYYLAEYDGGVYSVDSTGKAEKVFEFGKGDVISDAYAVGLHGDYVIFLPLGDCEPIMARQVLDAEILCDGRGDVVLSHSQCMGKDEALSFYHTASMTVSVVEMEGRICDAALLADGRAVVVCRREGEPFRYKLADSSTVQAEIIGKENLNEDALDGKITLPPISGNSAAEELVREIENEFGVRILYGEDIFELDAIGCTSIPATGEEVYQGMLLLKKVFSFLPAGTWKEVSGSKPMVVYLCASIQPSAGGINTVYRGYNLTVLSVGGTDEYFSSVAMHEFGHALERQASEELLNGWKALMPAEAQKVYGKEGAALTVEFTADDKGKTPVWFTDAYGRTNEMEDRATVFAHLYDAVQEGDIGLFVHEGLKEKAEYWARILRETYPSCQNAVFAWQALLG